MHISDLEKILGRQPFILDYDTLSPSYAISLPSDNNRFVTVFFFLLVLVIG